LDVLSDGGVAVKIVMVLLMLLNFFHLFSKKMYKARVNAPVFKMLRVLVDERKVPQYETCDIEKGHPVTRLTRYRVNPQLCFLPPFSFPLLLERLTKIRQTWPLLLLEFRAIVVVVLSGIGDGIDLTERRRNVFWQLVPHLFQSLHRRAVQPRRYFHRRVEVVYLEALAAYLDEPLQYLRLPLLLLLGDDLLRHPIRDAVEVVDEPRDTLG